MGTPHLCILLRPMNTEDINGMIYILISFLELSHAVFQYGSSHSVMEVTRENYDKCNTSDVLKTYSNGNTTVALSKPGDRYFVCGNKLHCLGGMKLPVHVAGDKAAASPVGSPQAQPADNSNLPQPSSKTNPSSQNVPNSSGFSISGRSTWDSIVVAGVLGYTMLWIMRQV